MQNGCALTPASGIWPRVALQESSDRDLLDSIAAGDRLAMRTLFARHNVRVYRFVLRLIGDESKAEDIVSEVFFAVWRQAGRFEGRSQVSTWILAIARYKAISVLRQRQVDTLEDDVAEAIADQADDPQIALEKKDTSILLRTCLKRLSQEHREIIDLVYYHEKSVDEAAEIVGVPRNTVKTRMFYARKRISELFEQAGGRRIFNDGFT
jgi:RNA polymerase sigma-70 factor (ECF subfamily)